MVKVAVFVEGQTELIFVREMLLKLFDYQNISLECYTLFTDNNFIPTEYAFPNENALNYFQIINVGSDTSVLSRIIRRKQFMWNAGFSKIIGLRDMYSKEYLEASGSRIINEEINQKFISTHNEIIQGESIKFHFGIMEVEAWILGMLEIFRRIKPNLDFNAIASEYGFNLEKIDPEKVFFKPANNLDVVMKFLGRDGYDKSKSEVNSLVSYMYKEDFIKLYKADKCNSYNKFYDSLIDDILSIF